LPVWIAYVFPFIKPSAAAHPMNKPSPGKAASETLQLLLIRNIDI